ncbi:MAG: helix-turn-helix domain-containing protein [Heliobacteriaceae bacterium]|jgi:transcriptional regulator with XRE-family HTH domain|nr:helix-turn-helix domain-containing protein [Heliobacteriaceae bacterium]
MDKKAFGARLKKLRKLHNLTQEQLAEAVSLDLRQVVRLEAGGSLPSLETLMNISGVLNISPNMLLNFSQENELKNDINDILTLAKPEQLELIKKIMLAIL